METNTDVFTLEQFHTALHTDIDKPVKDFRQQWLPGQQSVPKHHSGAHQLKWAESTIHFSQRLIEVKVYLNFKQNKLTDKEYEKLRKLACAGINQYWSRYIKVAGIGFNVRVKAFHRPANAIPVDLAIQTDPDKYSRSMNPSTLGVDAKFIYNQGYYKNNDRVNADFKLVSAHEFGHSVLMHAGGMGLSWGHKGSTNPILQKIKSSTPGYPESGPIDIMKYYDWKKNYRNFEDRIKDSIAMQIDVKRLIWGGKIKWEP